MQGRIRKINDNGVEILPVTHADAVYVGDSETLTQRLSTIGTGGSGGTSKLNGLVWNAMGDSITEHNYRTTTNYQDYIAQWTGCTSNTYGASGTGWFTDASGGAQNGAAFFRRVSVMDANADIITVFGGTNDYDGVNKPLVLGSMGDTDPEATFYGAVDSALTQIINRYPTATIAVFTPLPRSCWGGTPWDGEVGHRLVDISDAIIEVAHHYSIPVLDLYRESNMYVMNATYIAAEMPDNLHPNAAGHLRIAKKIQAFLESLI